MTSEKTLARRERTLVLAAATCVSAGLLAVTLWLTADGSIAAGAIAIVVAAPVAIAVWQPSPLVLLAGVLLLQVVQFGGEPGTSAPEAIAGLALVGYLGHWYLSAILSGRPLVRTLFDAAAVAYGTVGLVAAAVIGLMFGADAYDFRADVLAAIPFLFYLPVKELCAKDDRAGTVIALVLCVFGLVASLVNGIMLRSSLSAADELYKAADARFNVGETSITAGLMMALGMTALARQRAVRWLSVGLAGVLLAGLIVTRSRGFWIAAAFGIASMAVVAPGRYRGRLLGFLFLGGAAVVGLAVLVLGDQLLIVALGALDRLVSIGSATQDISLINRFAESQAAWEKIRVNPILGYGWGVQVTHYSIIAEGTRHWAFLHNGYLSIWYKTGLWGLAAMMFVWIGVMWRTARTARLAKLASRDRALALGAGATIAAFTPVAASSNPFSVLDQVLVVTLVLALGHGLADRAGAVRKTAPDTSTGSTTSASR
ncbi:MAG: O-antigen ligase family protein [Bacteroidota bacterium]